MGTPIFCEQPDIVRPFKRRIPLTVAEYFAGIGLVRYGLEREGWRVIFANDNSPEKLTMYKAYFRDSAHNFNEKNVFDLKPENVPLSTLATSSFPCIDLSLAGNMNGVTKGRHSSAFWGFRDILAAQNEQNLAPPFIMLENVIGWLYSNEGDDFRLTVKAVNDIGYYCDVFILDARRFTPLSRPRVFIIGTRHPAGSSDLAFFLRRSKSLSNPGLIKAVEQNGNLLWNYIDIPEPPSMRTSGLSAEVVELLPENDPRWWKDDQVERHLAMMSEIHRKMVDELRKNTSITYRTFFRRMRDGKQRAEVRKDEVAGCLRTILGGSSRQFILAAGNNQIRMRNMTPREYARLLGVPSDYPIDIEEKQALNGFGDAVCVPVISWIARNVLLPLVNQLYESKTIPEAIRRQQDNLQS
ncbi:MAG: DNA (cytosine-5-)-methyltransferase [Anaerolineaceae bacterium]|nr:DNA (cytosine-5-)-methyltransferase [Anaerolineaceae bacterium]